MKKNNEYPEELDFYKEFDKILHNVPNANNAVEFVKDTNSRKMDDTILKYAKLISDTIFRCIKNGNFIGSVNIDSDFYYLTDDGKDELFNPFNRLGYRFILNNPEIMYIIIEGD